MNKRIKELMDECTTTSRFSYEGTGGGYNTEYFDKEKFAKLIVKECADIADSYDHGSSDEWDRCARAIRGHIKRTFGVKG